MTEAILRRREAKPDEPLTEADAREAALQVARPIFFATLIIITAYLPLFAFQRIEAKLFYADGLCGRLCAIRRAAVRADAGSGPRLSRLSQAAARLPQSGARLDRSAAIGATLQRSLRSAADRLCAERRRRRRGRRGSARRSRANSCPSSTKARSRIHVEHAARHFACEGDARWPPSCARPCGSFPRSPTSSPQLGRNDDGTDPWTPSHIEAGIGLRPLRHLAVGRDQARI